MRFVCDSCRAQYMISDDKVGANGVKVRCKKCGNVIVVRRPQDTEADAALRGLEESAPQPPAPEAPTGENSIFSDVDDDEIGAAFESALGERQDDEPVAPSQDEPPPEANLPAGERRPAPWPRLVRRHRRQADRPADPGRDQGRTGTAVRSAPTA